MAFTNSTVRPLITKLQNFGPLSPEEEQVLEHAVWAVREIEAGADMVAEGASPDHSTLLLSGYAARYNITQDGAR
jgi:hypothetical protein